MVALPSVALGGDTSSASSGNYGGFSTGPFFSTGSGQDAAATLGAAGPTIAGLPPYWPIVAAVLLVLLLSGGGKRGR